jgi:hypothetical protein
MNMHTERTADPKGDASVQFRREPSSSPDFQPVNNRPDATAQRQIQLLADDAPQVRQLKAMQAKADLYASGSVPVVQKQANKTGLPDQLKAGIEQLSGYSLADVKVHYNSDKPKQVHAHAYAQGTDIHVSSGQEQHLAHEAWHVVQQKQGRVKPTVALKGVGINDDQSLEKEADAMGAKALQAKSDHQGECCCGNCAADKTERTAQLMPVVQRRRFLSRQQVTTLEEVIQNTLSAMEESGQTGNEYRSLSRAFQNVDIGGNSHAVMMDILNITSVSLNGHMQRLNAIIQQFLQTNGQNIRARNYPNAYSALANTARDNFRNGRLIPNTNDWTCPGNGRNRNAHAADVNDITVDHIIPCATHWNGIGYDSDRQTRHTWYSDPTNHRYMCRSCNSSLGSGGVMYRMDTGNNYSN